ncbi:MAG: hypothetical protein OEW62_03685 [Candidatus Bathyarchaeota archaeon]|nr:hypothetical protein [Candidatus Bathyarchaeota archaeon]MDH5595742.1 hypothetical protein [Candidatus Bathyarchaeota archaeon]
MPLSDPVALTGLVFLGIILVIIGVFFGSKTFKNEPFFRLGVVFVELVLVMSVFLNPSLLLIIGSLFGVMIVFSIFLSSIFLGIETLLLGVPSLILFAYSLFDHQNRFWLNIISVCLFFLGIVVSQLELRKPISEMLGKLFPAFAFSLAIVGVFLIPAVFPQFEFVTQIAELAGTIIGLSFLVLRRL